MASACERLGSIADRLAEEVPPHSPRSFLVALGEQAAGVRAGPFWWADAARGGRNHVKGGGFRREYDDLTSGQVRHFAGTVAVAARIGPRLTRLLVTHVLRDTPDTPDGRLSETALDLVESLGSGALPLAGVGPWIRTRLCR
ncbi:hypothetical protein ACFJGV_15585 [Cnuibacter sp. UC19_7]|uniref:hypothetical protein n=1 Tax=Cnuibacter sp. UC19_7 TaxID=3350166 RepID=UPI00366B070C